MKNRLIAGLLVLALLLPACGAKLTLQLGTMSVESKLTIDDWAQEKALEVVDKLLEEKAETTESPPEIVTEAPDEVASP